jgi:hypothetical protein
MRPCLRKLTFAHRMGMITMTMQGIDSQARRRHSLSAGHSNSGRRPWEISTAQNPDGVAQGPSIPRESGVDQLIPRISLARADTHPSPSACLRCEGRDALEQ